MRVPHPTPFLQDTSYFRQMKRLASAETMAYPTYMNKVEAIYKNAYSPTVRIRVILSGY